MTLRATNKALDGIAHFITGTCVADAGIFEPKHLTVVAFNLGLSDSPIWTFADHVWERAGEILTDSSAHAALGLAWGLRYATTNGDEVPALLEQDPPRNTWVAACDSRPGSQRRRDLIAAKQLADDAIKYLCDLPLVADGKGEELLAAPFLALGVMIGAKAKQSLTQVASPPDELLSFHEHAKYKGLPDDVVDTISVWEAYVVFRWARRCSPPKPIPSEAFPDLTTNALPRITRALTRELLREGQSVLTAEHHASPETFRKALGFVLHATELLQVDLASTAIHGMLRAPDGSAFQRISDVACQNPSLAAALFRFVIADVQPGNDETLEAERARALANRLLSLTTPDDNSPDNGSLSEDIILGLCRFRDGTRDEALASLLVHDQQTIHAVGSAKALRVSPSLFRALLSVTAPERERAFAVPFERVDALAPLLKCELTTTIGLSPADHQHIRRLREAATTLNLRVDESWPKADDILTASPLPDRPAGM